VRAPRRRVTERSRRAFAAAIPVPGEPLTLDPDESHHVARVLRLKAGDALSVFDGRGGEWDGTIADLSRDRVRVLVGAERPGRVEAALRVVLYQAFVRPEKIEWVLEKGTEIGVAEFRLVAADHAEAPPPSPARMARYERIVLTACKQSGRRTLPAVCVGPWESPGAGVLAIVCALAPGGPTLGDLLAGPPRSEVWLAVGPEGGFSEREIQGAAAQGWRRASLGPRVLRTETAGAVAAAIVLNRWGDLGPAVDSP
jgi:16S rRNA (uracil1498-N3)-methyltransferase